METWARNWLKRFKLRLQSKMITVACPLAYLELQSNIYDGAILRKYITASAKLSTIFTKKLHRRCSTGF